MSCFQVEKRQKTKGVTPHCDVCQKQGINRSGTYWFWILDWDRMLLCEKHVKEFEHIYLGCFEPVAA